MARKRNEKFVIYLDEEEAKKIRLYAGLLPLKASVQEIAREQLIKMVDAYLVNVKIEYTPVDNEKV